MSKANPDYSASAVNLINPPELIYQLDLLHQAQAKVKALEDELNKLELWAQWSKAVANAAEIVGQIKAMIEAQGSYQDLERGFYALKQRRESINYKPDYVRNVLEAHLADLVIVESVDSKILDGLVKGGLATPTQAKQCGEVKESFAYIIK